MTRTRPPLAAVTFDFWNTLCRADPASMLERRKRAWRDVAVARNIAVEPEVLDGVLDVVSGMHHHGWMSNVQFTANDALEHAAELLASVLGAGDHDALETAWMQASSRSDIQLTPHCVEVLRALQQRGTRIGIVCDVGLTPSTILREFLAGHGVLDAFDHWSFSDEVGVYKPHVAIFEHALEGLGVNANEALHIGDIRRTDIAGARAVGMRPVRYTGVADDDDATTEDAPVVIDDLRLLLAQT